MQQLVELEADAQQGQEAAPVGTPYWMAPEVGLLALVPRAGLLCEHGCLRAHAQRGHGVCRGGACLRGYPACLGTTCNDLHLAWVSSVPFTYRQQSVATATDIWSAGCPPPPSLMKAAFVQSVQVVELKSVTTASDIWSVGCLAIELLTGGLQVGGQVGGLSTVSAPGHLQAWFN